MDSTDVRLIGMSSVSRKFTYWSYKLNSPGRRYQCIISLDGRFLKIWGGYSPKVYDGQFVEMFKQELKNEFQGAKILADCHYKTAKGLIKGVEFFVPYEARRPRKRKRNDDGSNLECLTKKKQKWNQQVRQVRARVEHPFGELKQKWASLDCPFADGPEQLDCVFWIAAAVHNLSK